MGDPISILRNFPPQIHRQVPQVVVNLPMLVHRHAQAPHDLIVGGRAALLGRRPRAAFPRRSGASGPRGSSWRGSTRGCPGLHLQGVAWLGISAIMVGPLRGDDGPCQRSPRPALSCTPAAQASALATALGRSHALQGGGTSPSEMNTCADIQSSKTASSMRSK